jgi:hypothetical protein
LSEKSSLPQQHINPIADLSTICRTAVSSTGQGEEMCKKPFFMKDADCQKAASLYLTMNTGQKPSVTILFADCSLPDFK